MNCLRALACLVTGLMAWPAMVGYAADPSPRIRVLVAYYSQTGNTEAMAKGVAEGAKTVEGTIVILKRVERVTAEDLFAADALVVGSPVYWANMAGPVKVFFDDWQLRFGVFPEFKMRDKVGAAFATGGQVSGGKEVPMLTILAAMLGKQMIVVVRRIRYNRGQQPGHRCEGTSPGDRTGPAGGHGREDDQAGPVK